MAAHRPLQGLPGERGDVVRWSARDQSVEALGEDPADRVVRRGEHHRQPTGPQDPSQLRKHQAGIGGVFDGVDAQSGVHAAVGERQRLIKIELHGLEAAKTCHPKEKGVMIAGDTQTLDYLHPLQDPSGTAAHVDDDCVWRKGPQRTIDDAHLAAVNPAKEDPVQGAFVVT